MNELDNQNDPFEEVFRNRFANFESEPDTQLWNKIEPQLPVDSTRMLRYWQISTIIILMLLLGWSVYRSNQPIDTKVIAKEDIMSLKEPIYYTKKLVAFPIKKTPVMGNLKLPLKQNNELKQEKIIIQSSDSQIVNKKYANNIEIEKDNILSAKIEEPQTVFVLGTNSNRMREKSVDQLNLLNETPQYSRVSYQENSILEAKKNSVTILNSKQYHLLSSQFKMPKLNPIIKPKEDEYYKETQPIDVYMSVMPLMNYYTITPEGNEANYVHNIVINNDADRLGFYTQAGAIFTLSDRFKLRTGLTFTKTNHSIDYSVRTDSLIVQSPNNKSVDVSFAELDKTYSQIANYLGAKVEVQYILFKSEPLTHYVNVGLEGAYRLNGNQQLNGFANIAYGVSRQIGKNTYLFVEPTFSYSLNQQSDKNSFLLVKPNKIGFNIGVNVKVK